MNNAWNNHYAQLADHDIEKEHQDWIHEQIMAFPDSIIAKTHTNISSDGLYEYRCERYEHLCSKICGNPEAL